LFGEEKMEARENKYLKREERWHTRKARDSQARSKEKKGVKGTPRKESGRSGDKSWKINNNKGGRWRVWKKRPPLKRKRDATWARSHLVLRVNGGN